MIKKKISCNRLLGHLCGLIFLLKSIELKRFRSEVFVQVTGEGMKLCIVGYF